MTSNSKLTFSILLYLVFSACLLTVSCKSKKALQFAADSPCLLKPDPGPCKGSFTMYYYDGEEGKCKSFTYGGCEGVVPFKSMKLCLAACGEE